MSVVGGQSGHKEFVSTRSSRAARIVETQGDDMRRRDFVAGLFWTKAVWPTTGEAQEGHVRRVGFLGNLNGSDPEVRTWIGGLREGLAKSGWTEGRNVTIVPRFANGRPDQLAALAKELVALNPDVILAHAPPSTLAVKRETAAIPVVFVAVSDPVGSGMVASLARPGGSLTGFLTFELGIVGKWLSMLKEIAPGLERVALVANPRTTNFDYFEQSARAAGSTLRIELVPVRISTAAEIGNPLGILPALPTAGCSCLRTRPACRIALSSSRLPPVIVCRPSIRSGFMSRMAD
jgi:putative tryptophan/tyrosine transport system substrate-binding protein